MFLVDRLILVAAVLLLLAVVSSKLSSRLGLPFLVIFVAVGMLAGSEGIGGIPFEDYALAHAIGILALAVILFDGGLRTSGAVFRTVWPRGVSLATVGVVITTAITGLAASAILGVDLLVGLLLGAIVGSTDAAAVFAIFRQHDLNVDEDLAATLEIESGSNDPLAVLLTVALLEILTGERAPGAWLVGDLVLELAIGGVAGVVIGVLGAKLINRIDLDAAGLYPVLGGTVGLLAYGGAASLGGSGFLSVYLAGIVLGNSRIVFRRPLFLFHDGVAWLAQLVMFVMLGLLSFPSRLASVAGQGLLIAAILVFVARPIAVWVSLLPFRMRAREIAFISWAGLKGAVPIVLALYPLIFGLPGGLVIFDIAFFVVLVSAATQGWSLPLFARWLGLQRERPSAPPVSLEITSLRKVEGDIVEYTVVPGSRAAGRRVRELALPDGAIVSLIVRAGEVIAPRGSTRIEAGDFVFVLLRAATRLLVDRIFSPSAEPLADLPEGARFPLRGRTKLGDLAEFYDLQLPGAAEETLEALLRRELGDLAPGSSAQLGGAGLIVVEMDGDRVERVDLVLPLEQASEG